MADIINLLPDSIANQIAAGEVIQRPSSVVKELLENSIDSGASEIKLIIKDAGKTLIQVVDNGCGMSETDARMCFERHATSKIQDATGLYNLQTKGFRGEALASIASVAHVELKTKQAKAELGTLVEIEGSKVNRHEPTGCPDGTSFSVKNLFFNIPARRKFLKSDNVEIKHITDEFLRVALVHNEIAFSFFHNTLEIYQLPSTKRRQRIVHVMGRKFNDKLVPLEESTDIVTIQGFIGKPEASKKTRGEQFFFVNDRFIKSGYFHHAIMTAFEDLIPERTYPPYFIYMQVDPGTIDINIHPTKTEVKFEEEKAIYAILRSATRQSIGKHQLTPSLDFERETTFDVPPLQPGDVIKSPEIQVNPEYNPFETSPSTSGTGSSGGTSGGGHRSYQPEKPPVGSQMNWTEWADKQTEFTEWSEDSSPKQSPYIEDRQSDLPLKTASKVFQIHNRFVISTIKSGMLLIDQNKAHQRIIFERFKELAGSAKIVTQKLLFPVRIEVDQRMVNHLKTIHSELYGMGFEIEFEEEACQISGIPSEFPESDLGLFIDDLCARIEMETDISSQVLTDRLAASVARSAAIKSGQELSVNEMETLVDNLFACETPNFSPSGAPCVVTITLEELIRKFQK